MTLHSFETARVALPIYATRLDKSRGPVNRLKQCERKRVQILPRAFQKRLNRLRAHGELLRAMYEALVIQGNLIYENLRLAELLWRKSVLHGENVYDFRRERDFTDCYRAWIAPAPNALKRIAKFEAYGQRIRGAKEFREHYSEVSKILAGEDPFFADSLTASKWQRATEFMRPNPQPVRVDASGRIFDETGNPIVMPGLEPHEVLSALEDARIGNVYSLDEVVAALEQHEL